MLAILTTHPIQYQVPLWTALQRDGRIPFEVWYLGARQDRPSLDREFGVSFQWDLDMLSGYPHRFLNSFSGASPESFWTCRLRENLGDRIRTAGVRALWVHGWQVLAYWQAVRRARLAKVSVWLRGDSNDLRPVPPWKVPLKRLQLGLLFRQCDGFFCVGEANRRLYERHAVPRGKLYKATHFVDNRRFGAQAAALRPRRAELRSKFGIPAGAFCVLFCGKLIEKKRPMDVVRAAEHLRKSLHAPPIHLLFVGDGELRDTLRRACSVVFDQASGHPELGTGPISKIPASFTGFLNQTEISQAYVAADCLVLPSDYGETWGLVVNEALASHLPCIVSEACGCAENLVSPEQRFPLGNVEALANRIENAACGAATVISPPDIGETVEAVVRAYRGLPSKPAVF